MATYYPTEREEWQWAMEDQRKEYENRIAALQAELDSVRKQQGSGLRGDPVAPRTVNGEARDQSSSESFSGGAPQRTAEGWRPIVERRCKHCGEEIRQDGDGWMDRETHHSCASGANEDKPHEPVEQSEDTELVAAITAIVREADETFQRMGGSSRHWVRDCFLPLLNQRGWILSSAPGITPPQEEP